ncbi:two-component system sensor histidine kinase NtrB, partial [Comamonas sp. 4034]|uniref:two-component system sensor histidine kinase NtrB n=1 Tax=Comamonas sp. 4034 TaxID=3156455 RepID=UPI003D21C3C9
QFVVRYLRRPQFVSLIIRAYYRCGPDLCNKAHMTNQAYANLLGWNPPELVGKCCHLVSRGSQEACPSTLITCPVVEVRKHTRPLRSMMSLRRADGSTVDVDIDAAPLIMEDGRTLVIEVLRPLERSLRFSQQQRLSTLGLLANGVAHEIHNPLASIRIALQASLRGLQKGQMEHHELVGYLKLVDHEIDRCVMITQRLMQMSQAPSETLHPVNLTCAVDDVLALLREECRIRNVYVSMEDWEPVPSVLGDEAELRQVLVNLVHNALHAMPDGGHIHILGIPVKAENRFRLSVRDTGCGIAAEDLPLIFMPFFSRRVDGRRGMGLGLAISKAAMERFGGSIDVTSRPGQGACFTLTLVCASAPSNP